MDQWLPLGGIIILILILWFVWSLTRNRTALPDRPDPELIRPRDVRPDPAVDTPMPADAILPGPADDVATEPAAAGLTAIGVPAADGPPDDLRRLKGLGPKLNTLLTGLGVTRFDQIAAWNAEDIARIDPHLGTFSGRIVRDNWVEQARLLASGDIAGYEAKFGKLDASGG
jgi:predicted flap endonuclease-1-like 5' DNA nuclease